MRKFSQHIAVDEIILVADNKKAYVQTIVLELQKEKPIIVVPPGQTRMESVKNGVCKAKGDYVAIHDGARPFITDGIITDTLQKAMQYGAAAPAVAVKDTIKKAKQNIVLETPNRSELFAVQTPQCFLTKEYLSLLENTSIEATDDCMIYEQAGKKVFLTQGSYENKKITTSDDLPKREEKPCMKIGHGYDVHRLVQGRKLILGGVDIPFSMGLLGHSDADVLTHAIMDALLGAAAKGDIGALFPDTDPAFSGADSIELLKKVGALLAQEAWEIDNLDATIICQKPKLAPYINQMRENIAQALALQIDVVSVKATTEEKLGFTGEGLGIAVHAVCLLHRNKCIR